MMFDRRKKTASLRGFDAAAADIGDQLHLRHPLLSFDGDRTLYVARRFNWRDDQRALTVADPSEASELATLLPDAYRRPIESGEAVVVAGAEFVQAVTDAGIQLDGSEMSFTRIHESKCWMSTAKQVDFEKLQTRLAKEALTAFDEALGSAARERCQLSEHGSGALLVLRGCGTRWREELAIRELAGAKQNCEFDLYRRLLDGFSIELDAQLDNLHRQVERHIELASSPRPVTVEGVEVLDTDSALKQTIYKPRAVSMAAGDLARGLVAKGLLEDRRGGTYAITEAGRQCVAYLETNEIELLCQARDNSPGAIGPFADSSAFTPSYPALGSVSL